MSHRFTILRAVAAVVLVTHFVTARADDIILSIDETISNVTLSLSDPMFGTWTAQAPGSDVASVTGHFLVSFAPFAAGGPSTIQFQGGHGYLAFGNTAGGAAFGPWNTPANFAHQTPGNEFQLAFQNTVWDWFSDPIDLPAGNFDSNGVGFGVLQGSYSGAPTGSPPAEISTDDFSGYFDQLNGPGPSTLAETAPGSGQWVLTTAVSYTVGLANDIVATFAGTITARATYGTNNVAPVDPQIDPLVEVLGGPSQVGGVSAVFNGEESPGTFSAQQIPFTGLSPAAIEAGTQNPIFALSTSDVGVDPQIWEVNYDGALAGPVTLVFGYDPAKLPLGTDESLLGIWHFNQGLGRWQFGGTVDTVAHTVSYTTDSFSPFVLGVAVPEPTSWALLASGLAAASLGLGGRRRHVAPGAS